MKAPLTYSTKKNHQNPKLRFLQLVFFFACLLLASKNEAQSLVDLNVSDCQSRLGNRGSHHAEHNFIIVAAFRTSYNFYANAPDLSSFSIELGGTFGADDLNNSSGGALFYTKSLTGFPPSGSMREIALGEKVITGPGVYTFEDPLVSSNATGSTQYGYYYILLELSPDADESDIWFRQTMTNSNFLFDPPLTLSGSVPFKTGTTEPGAELVDINYSGKNGFIQAEIEPSNNEGYTFEVRNSASNQLVLTKTIGDGVTTASLAPLSLLTEYDISVTARKNLPGCVLEETLNVPGNDILSCFPDPPAPTVDITSLSFANMRVDISGLGSFADGPDIGASTFMVMREVGSPRLAMSDGDYPIASNTPAFHWPFGTFDLGNGNYYVNTQSGQITGLTAGTTYELDVYHIGFNVDGAPGLSGGESCILYSPVTRTTFTTCEGSPAVKATNFSVTNVGENSATLSWTNGDGAARLVLLGENVSGSFFNGISFMHGEDFDANTYFPDAPLVEYGFSAYPNVVYKGTANSVTVTGLETSTNYGFFVLEYEGDGFCRSYLSSSSGNFATVSNDLSVSTQNVTNRTANSAVGGGEIELINNVTVTEKGLVWSTSYNPDINDSKASAGAGSGAFTASMTGLSAARSYFVRAYAMANGQVFYGNNRQFYTTAIEPTDVPSNLELVSLQPTTGNNLSAVFDWDAASDATGYLLLYRQDGTLPTTTGIEDGIHPEDLDLTSGTLVAGDDIIDGSGFTQNYGVTAGLTYNYLVIPLSADQDNHPQTINYKTIGAFPTLSFVADVQEPEIIDLQPVNRAIDVPVSGILSVKFNENVVVGSGNIDVIDDATGNTIRSIPVGSTEVAISNKVVTIDPLGLPLSTEVYVNFPAGAFVDENGNAMKAFQGKGAWQFTTAAQGDVTPPTLVSLLPKSTTTSVNVNSEFTLDFNEPVTFGSGNITFKRLSDNTNVQVIPINDPRVVSFQSRLSINPDLLPGSTSLYITVDNGAITDLSGNAYAGFNDANTWSFTTVAAPDVTPPLVVGLTPADDQTNVPLSSSLMLSFNESVQANEGFIAIRFVSDGSTREIIDVESNALSFNASQTTATIELTNEFPAQTALYVEVSAGSFTDDAGNLFAGIVDPTAWSFTTTVAADGNQPQLLASSLSPITGSTNVAFDTNLAFSFNENVVKGTGNILVTNLLSDELEATIDVTSGQVSLTNNIVTINPSVDLGEGTFKVNIPSSAFKDVSDNFYPGLSDQSWTFTTVSNPPTLSSTLPTDNATDVALDATFTMTFSEEVEPGSGFFEIRRVDNNTLVFSLQPEEVAVNYNGQVVSIEANLPPSFFETDLYVRVTQGFVQDLNGNPFSGLTDNTAWNFTTESQVDLTGPQVVLASLSPANDAINVDPDADLSWSFNESVIPSTGNIYIRAYDSNQLIETILPSSVSIDASNIVAQRSNVLPEGHFYIEMEEGAFEDALGNLSQEISDKEIWDFYSIGIPPAVEELIPAVGTANVGQIITAIATFDEQITAGSGNILVRNFNTNATLATIPIDDAAVTISSNTLTVEVDLSSYFDIPVYIQVGTGAVTDLFSNALTELNNNSWNYTLVTAPDVTPPSLFGGTFSALSPQRGGGTTDPNALLEMTFNEEVQAGSGIITLHRYSDDLLLQGISTQDAGVTFNGNVVTIDPLQIFDDVQTYVLVSSDAFQDNSGNFFAGISDKNDWYFYPEISRPELISMSPAVGTTGIPVGEPVTFGLTFSENIQIDDTGFIRALRKDNNAIAATTFLDDASVQVQGNQLIFDMTFLENEAFSELEMYLSLNGTYITDLNGNNATSFGSFAITGFTAEEVDLSNPGIIQFSYLPADHTNNVPYDTDLSFEMSEEVLKASGNINIRNLADDALIRSIDVTSSEVSISGTTVTINPASDLPEAQLYIEVENGTFKDAFGNLSVGPLTDWENTWRLYMFEEPLEIVSFSPAHGTTNVQVNDPLTFEATFSHPIEINPIDPGDIFIRYNQGNAARYTIPANDPSVSVDGNKLSFDLTLDPGMGDFELWVQLGYGVVQDVDGISKNLTLGKGNWHFTTENETPPEAVSFSPVDDATNVSQDTDFLLTFNEDVTKLNFYAIIRDYISSAIVEVFDNNHTGVTVSGNQVTLNPTSDLEEGKSFYVTLSYNAVQDHEGAGNIGFTLKDDWNFSVGDTEDPVLVALTPNDDATEVALDAVFTMEFDEPVQTDGAGSIILRRSSGSLVENVSITDPRITGLGTNTLTIDFNSTLITSVDYYITIGNGVVEDAIGNTFKGFTDTDTWSFSASTADIINPTLVSLSPEDDEGNAATNTSLVITLNEDIQWGTGEVLLKDFATDNLIEAFNTSSGNTSISGGELTINPTSDLSEVTQYYIEVESDALEDVSGNTYAGFSGKTTWNFTTLNSDVTGPSIVSFFPADDDTTVPEDIGSLQIVFDEPIQLAGGFFALRFVAGNSLRQQFNVGTPDVTISGNTVTLNGVNQLATHADYYIQEGTLIQDLAGNQGGDWSGNTTWNFSTFSDIIAPTVTSFDPPTGTTSVAEDASFVMTMSEDILVPATYAITIKEKQGNSTVESFLFTNDPEKIQVNGNQVVINPENDLASFTEYYITVSGFRDVASNQFAGFSDNATWSFVVGELDNDPPTITSLTPANGSTDVPLEIGTFSMTFSDPVFPVPGAVIRLRNVGGNAIRQEFPLDSEDVEIDGNTLTISNVNKLTPGWNYWLQGGSVVTDEAGNLLTGWANNATTWSFTTEEIPNHIALSPADNAIDISPSSDLIMTFNKPVVKGTGFIKIYDYIEQTEILSINVTSSNVAVIDDEVTISIPGGLPDFNLQVYALIDEGAFVDENGNEYEGINSRFSWDFTLESTDQTAPSIVSTSPVDNATGINIDTDLIIEFDEDVFIDNGTAFRIKNYSNNSTFQTIIYPSENITVDGNTIIIDPPFDQQFIDHLWIEVPANRVRDEVGNSFNGITVGNRDDWDFTTISHLNILSFTPADNSTGVAPDTDLTFQFERNVLKGAGYVRILDDVSGAELMAIDVSSNEVSLVGNEAIVSPNGGLPDDNIRVRINVDAGAFVDVFGNPSIGFNSANTWDFDIQSTDVTAPFIVSITPPDNGTGVSIDTDLVIEYNEDIFLGNSSFLVKLYSNNVNSQVINYASNEVSVNGNIITIDLDAPLELDQHYWIQINPATITDAVGNENAGITNKDDWDFFTVSPTPPQVVSFNPADESIQVPVDANLVITFDEPVQSNGIVDFVRLYNKTSGSNLAQLATTNSNYVIFSGNTITLNSPVDLPESEEIYVTLPSDGISDAEGTLFAGWSDNNTWNFTTVTKSDQTITFDAITDQVFGSGAFNLSATSSSGLDVAFSVVNGPVILNGNEVSITGTGSVTIAANQAGNGLYNPATEVTQTFTVLKADQTITFDVIEDKVFGDGAFTLAGNTTSGLPITYSVVSGPVSINGNAITIDGAGVATIAANQEGDENYHEADEVTRSFIIEKASQLITIDPIADKLTTDTPFEVSASVNTGLGLTYEVNGPATILGTTISLDGIIGTVTVSVSQAGNENYQAALESTSFEVIDTQKMDQTITFEAISVKNFGDDTFLLNASSSSGLPVQFSVISGPVSLIDNEVTITGAGTAVIAADQSGDTDYNPADQAIQTFSIEKANQVITLDPITDKAIDDGPFDVFGTIDSGLELTYEVDGPASMSGITVTLLGTEGTVNITVSQAGNENYHSSNATTSFEVIDNEVLSVDELTHVKVYPNPVSNFLQIESDNEISVRLFDIQGKLVLEDNIQVGKLDLRELNQGVYLLKLIHNQKKMQVRIIKAN